MKLAIALTLAVAAVAPSSAFAHGSLAKQATDAVTAATALFSTTQTPEVVRQFAALSATLTGRERFAVVIKLKNATELHFDCVENEEVDPVVWGCTAL